MNLYEGIEKIKAAGYSEQNAQAKLGQDIVLKAIADSGMAQNATIKGGVVMRSLAVFRRSQVPVSTKPPRWQNYLILAIIRIG